MKTYMKGKSKAKHKNIIRVFHPTSGPPNKFKKPSDPPRTPELGLEPQHMIVIENKW
jgi:hypothetical protein